MKDMHVGLGTLDELQSLLSMDLISHADINKFCIKAKGFLVTILEKMFRKNLLSFNIVKYMSVLDPKVFKHLVYASHYLENWYVRLLDQK